MCATSRNASIANRFLNFYSHQRFEPCPWSQHSHPGANEDGSSQVGVERIDLQLPDYYVVNTTVLLDDPRNFDDKVSRMFSQLSSGEVVGLVASFVMFALFSYLVWSQLLKFYKRHVLGISLTKVRSSVGSLSRLLRIPSRPNLDNDEHHDDRLPSGGGPPQAGGGGGRNSQIDLNRSQKDKMVATLLVQMRTEGTAAAEQEQQQRLQLGGLTNPTAADVNSARHTIVDISSHSNEDVLVNRSQLPPLSEGRVLAVVGARIVEDGALADDDARSSATFATQVSSQQTSEFTSPLYDDDERGNSGGRVLRLRRHLD